MTRNSTKNRTCKEPNVRTFCPQWPLLIALNIFLDVNMNYIFLFLTEFEVFDVLSVKQNDSINIIIAFLKFTTENEVS